MDFYEAVYRFLYEGDVPEKALIKHPSISVAIVVLYVLFVKWIGPAIMKNRERLELKYVMIFYDFGQVFINGYLTYTIYNLIWETWPERCMVKYNLPILALYMKRILVLTWHIYLVKLADLIDTCLFVLRKKDSQISFLHIFHHAVMVVLLPWLMRNFDTDAVGFYLAFSMSINTSVHCVVYFYYGLAALGPHMDKHLWWKKYLTQFQMVQFTLILGYIFHGFWTGCEEVGKYEIAMVIYVVLVYIMFIDFYKKYKKE